MPAADDNSTTCLVKWRWDAFGLILACCAAIVTASVVGSPQLNAGVNLFGPAGNWVAQGLFDTLGVGLILLLAGWAMVCFAYIAGQSWLRLVALTTGFALASLCLAASADFFGWQTPTDLTLYGTGGAIGAMVRYLLSDHLAAPLPQLSLILMAAVSLTLILPRTLLSALHWTGRVLHTIGKAIYWVIQKTFPAFGRKLSAVYVFVAGVLLQAWQKVRQLARKPEVVPLVPVEVGGQEVPITRNGVAGNPWDTPPPMRGLEPLPASPPTTAAADSIGYEFPPLDLLADPDSFPVEDHEQRLRERANLLEKTFLDFNLNIKVVGIHTGPVITQYEVALETGLRLNKVTNLADDLALNLGVTSVRIVAPLPGRNTVGIEVPNDHRQTVRLKELILATTAKSARLKLPVFLGKDVEGQPLVYDMATMPHLLIAGRTGTGKSVCLNSIIMSFLFSRTPEECRLLLIDPKKVEFSDYCQIPHLMHPVVTDDKKAEAILAWAVDKMEERYELLRRARVRNIASYNELGREELIRRVDPQTEEERQALPDKLPYIVMIIDEVGDLLMAMKKEVESHIIRLAQKSRAAGIHLILATQKPTVDVITGLIKSNLPARVCFQVASRADSAVVLDEKGAEKLLGQGDMLFLQPGTSTIIRGQGAYVDDREIERVTSTLAEIGRAHV